MGFRNENGMHTEEPRRRRKEHKYHGGRRQEDTINAEHLGSKRNKYFSAGLGSKIRTLCTFRHPPCSYSFCQTWFWVSIFPPCLLRVVSASPCVGSRYNLFSGSPQRLHEATWIPRRQHTGYTVIPVASRIIMVLTSKQHGGAGNYRGPPGPSVSRQ